MPERQGLEALPGLLLPEIPAVLLLWLVPDLGGKGPGEGGAVPLLQGADGHRFVTIVVHPSSSVYCTPFCP